MLKVYLAGGFRSSWQDTVIQEVNGLVFFDPRAHALSEKTEYTLWDLEAIRNCDILFGYFEADNPGGFALALEVGFAKALGKRIIFVDEKSRSDDQMKHYLGMVHAVSDTVIDDLEQGIALLRSFALLTKSSHTESQ